ncbi:ABC transporter ATP-binding protein [Bradyrhizobium sp. CCBAU 45384]|uniref:ABC transporter ATP-binding protein n=1 Tax=Bradyrhizobium sp. CCBAU 45384 TaxID=858428 RepID=UPI002305E5B2|nr:dipeptide ABC transporter ATP-binding protein [Bradyrhizobium sp. CCBAU 45384]MDA9406168.1 hypothetical protein [Bradyrhizobium sp. CCBAU 45384]
MSTALLEVRDLKKHYGAPKGAFGHPGTRVKAVDGVSFSVYSGETLGLVGESGCGKSTVGKLIMRLSDPTGGMIRIDGSDITHAHGEPLRQLRRRVQMVFQDPYASLNGRMRAGAIVREPLENFDWRPAKELDSIIADLFGKVGLQREAMQKFPFEFSGGQRQRLGIARALVLSPELIVADEPVSALDVSVQAQVINLLMDLQQELGVAYLFISHDLGVVEHIAHRVAVMYFGRIVEIGQKKAVFDQPAHPYTRSLIAAAPVIDPALRRERVLLEGEIPSHDNPPAGCAFHSRCPFAFDRCRVERPELTPRKGGQLAACHLND